MSLEKSEALGMLSEGLAEACITPHVELYLGLICNIQCPYCYLPYKKRLDDELPIEFLLAKLKALGWQSVEILGGEPFVYRNKLLYLLNFVSRNNVRITAMSTNGLIYDRAIVEALRNSGIGYLQVSVDAATAKTYSVVRSPVPGLFDKAIANIKRFVSDGMPLSMSFVIMKPNLDEITNFVKLARGLGVSRVSFGTVTPIGEGKNVGKWFLSQKEYEMAGAEIKKLRAEMPEMELIFNGANDVHGDLCSAGVNKVAVLPNGDVYSCGLFIDNPKFKLGNIDNGLDAHKIIEIFGEEDLNSQRYWEKCVACKLSVREHSTITV